MESPVHVCLTDLTPAARILHLQKLVEQFETAEAAASASQAKEENRVRYFRHRLEYASALLVRHQNAEAFAKAEEEAREIVKGCEYSDVTVDAMGWAGKMVFGVIVSVPSKNMLRTRWRMWLKAIPVPYKVRYHHLDDGVCIHADISDAMPRRCTEA
jgi:hypothetical protein